MGKSSNRKLTLEDKKQLASREGELVVSFVFDGRLHTRTHQFNAGEIARMKEMCVTHGDEAADQVLWRMAVRNSGWFAENVLAVAGKAYVLKHHKNAPAEAAKMKTVFETPAPTYADLLKGEDNAA